MNRFDLMNLCKDLVFCFVRHLDLCSLSAEISQADGDKLKGTRHQDMPELWFAEEQLDETCKVVSTWMERNHYRPRAVSSLGKELKVLFSMSCSRILFVCTWSLYDSCGMLFFSVTRYLMFCSRHGAVYYNRK